jgi:hypothetical protein
MRAFISYYHKTGWFAASMFEQWLRDASIEAIRDQRHFHPGKLPKVIEQNIQGADVLLVVLSHNFYQSAWTKQEINLAKQFGKPVYYVATGEGYRIKDPPTFEDFSEDLALELWRMDAYEWRDRLINMLKKLIEIGQVREYDQILTSYFSKNVGCNHWVKEAIERENIAHSLYVSSCVELAHSLNGWTGGRDFFPHNRGPFTPEPEVLEYLSNHLSNEDSLKQNERQEEAENCALISLSDWLSDTEYVELNFQSISHDLVRQVADNFAGLYYQKSEAERPHLFDLGRLAFPHSVIVHMVLVTRDNYLIIGQRSATPRFYENCWATTYEEHMRISSDHFDPFRTAIRGIKEELVEEDRADITRDSVRFFSIFRELDNWQNTAKGLNFWDINIGIAGIIQLKHLSADDVFRHWLRRKAEGSGPGRQDPEFQHLAAITFSFNNLLQLIMKDKFDPTTFPDLRVPAGVNKEFPNITAAPWLQRQHPTNKIRLIRCLTSDYENFRATLTNLLHDKKASIDDK